MLTPEIHHDGLTLRPLTMQVITLYPGLDPAWMAKRIAPLYRPGDAIYYWDGPWGALSGSRGLALVRRGRVVERFTTLVS